jgi:hypothetical protein
MLSENTTLKTLDVSDNSFGKLAVGDQVKLKSSGEMKVVTDTYGDGDIKVEGGSGYVKRPSEFEWESQFPAFCAGLKCNSALESLDISKNGLGPAGGEVLADGLLSNSVLLCLHVFSNSMGAEGGKLILDSIKTHSNSEQILQNMFDGKVNVDMSNKRLDAGFRTSCGARCCPPPPRS